MTGSLAIRLATRVKREKNRTIPVWSSGFESGTEGSMQRACRQIVCNWGSTCRLKLAEYVWILAMFGILAVLEGDRIGLYLIPPFAATLTILLMLPDAAVAQPYAIVAGSLVGASVGTLVSL